jgi:hypothetical protein
VARRIDDWLHGAIFLGCRIPPGMTEEAMAELLAVLRSRLLPKKCLTLLWELFLLTAGRRPACEVDQPHRQPKPAGEKGQDAVDDVPVAETLDQRRVVVIAPATVVVIVVSEPGDLVLDLFSGSATTGVACLELGRRYLGIEEQAAFVKLSRGRLQASAPA